MATRWWLEDAEVRRRQCPYTFYVPSKHLIDQLQAGDSVKLIFAFDSDVPTDPAAERMWVKITSVSDAGFVGVLDNQARYIRGLELGTVVPFGPEHIIDTSLGEDDELQEFAVHCFVSRRVFDREAPVGYIYREQPEFDNDSGWRILAGDESDDYLDDSRNVLWVILGAVLNRDDSFVGLLASPVGSAFIRDGATGAFLPAE